MTALREKEIAQRLASVAIPPPPPDLLDRLKEDIPAVVSPLVVNTPETPRWYSRRYPFLAAASVAIAVVGVLLALRVTESPPRSSSLEPLGEASQVSSKSNPQEVVRGDSVHGGGEPSSAGAPPAAMLPLAGPSQEKAEASPPAASSAEAENTAPGGDAMASPAERASRQTLSRELEELVGKRDAASLPSPPPSPPPAPPSQPSPESSSELSSGATSPRAGRTVPSAPKARKVAPPDAVENDELVVLPSFQDAIQVQGEAPKDIVSMAVGSEVDRRLEEPRRQVPKPVAMGGVASTGGTAEPNDQPYGDVFFRHTGTNPFVDAEEDPLSTFGLDVDTGSYSVLRRYLLDGHVPPPEAVRVEEVVNAFDYGDPPPRQGDFALYGEGAETPFAGGSRYRLLRFAVQGRVVEAKDRKPATLVFVVDVSGSMNRGDRLGLVKKSLGLLLDELRPDDRVGLVVFGSRGQVLLEPTSDLGAIRSAIDRVTPGGSTNAEEGLVLGYQQASNHFQKEGIHRVILCSDGVANVGRTGSGSLLARIRKEAAQGIELTTLGFGMGNYNDALMERLADEGNGRYAYLDSLAEARRVLVEDLTGTLQTIASEARAQVEFNPQAVERYRLLGYENRDIADERFRDDSVDAGEIGAGHGVTVLYEVKLAEKARKKDTLATLRLRYRSAATGRFEEVAQELTVNQAEGSWENASRSLRLASLVAETAEIIKQTYWARGSDLEEVFRRLQALASSTDGPSSLEAREPVAELLSLVGKAALLAKEEAAGER